MLAGVITGLAAMVGLGVGIGYATWGGSTEARASFLRPLRPSLGAPFQGPAAVHRAFLGVEVDTGTGTGTGASGAHVVAVVPTSPAAKAGIVSGDTITAFGSTTVTSASGLARAVSAAKPGSTVKVSWTTTSGAHKSATITLGTRAGA